MEYLSPQGVLLPRVYGTTTSPLWLELRGPAAWQATPAWAVCRQACNQLLPWLRATFAMVPDAAWPGSDQRPWRTATATGRLGCASASNPGSVGRGALSLCCPWCMCVCGVLAHVALVHRCARCVGCVWAVGGFVPPPPPVISLFLFCPAFFFKTEKGARAHCRHRHGQLVPRCKRVVFSGMCRRCLGGDCAPGLWLACPDVHGYKSGWVWLVASLLLVLAG